MKKLHILFVILGLYGTVLADEIPVDSPQMLYNAVASAQVGDRVILKAETFYLTAPLVIDKDLILCAEGPEKARMVGLGKGDVLIVVEAKVALENLVIESSRGDHSAGIRVIGGSVELHGCELRWNENAIWAGRDTLVVLRDTVVVNNNESGLILDDSAKARIVSSTFAGNVTGIEVRDTAEATVTDSTFRNNVTGIRVTDYGRITLVRCDISGEDIPHGPAIWGVHLSGGAEALLQGCRIISLWRGVELQQYAKLTMRDTEILRSRQYALLLYCEECVDVFYPTARFVAAAEMPALPGEAGRIRGVGNRIPGPDVPEGNRGTICPAVQLPPGFIGE